jgi:hypothetical protein
VLEDDDGRAINGIVQRLLLFARESNGIVQRLLLFARESLDLAFDVF